MRIYQTGANSYANGIAEVNVITGEFRGDKASAFEVAVKMVGGANAARLLPKMRQLEGPVSDRGSVGGSSTFRPCI